MSELCSSIRSKYIHIVYLVLPMEVIILSCNGLAIQVVNQNCSSVVAHGDVASDGIQAVSIEIYEKYHVGT